MGASAAFLWRDSRWFPLLFPERQDFIPKSAVEVPFAEVRKDGHNDPFFQPLRDLKDALQRRAAGVSHQKALFPGHPADHFVRVFSINRELTVMHPGVIYTRYDRTLHMFQPLQP